MSTSRKKILHLSDIHFGRLFEPALLYLKSFIEAQANSLDLIVVSGDWTQRARHKQFQQALQFIREIKQPILSVPGNHDIPLYKIHRRLLNPYKRYEHYIGDNTLKEFQDDLIAVAGMSTVNRFAVASGKLKDRELTRVREFFKAAEKHVKILVCHHPLHSMIHNLSHLDTEPHVILTGHTHDARTHALDLDTGHRALLVSCGTTTSSRYREAAENHFNLIEIDNENIRVQPYYLGKTGFATDGTEDILPLPPH